MWSLSLLALLLSPNVRAKLAATSSSTCHISPLDSVQAAITNAVNNNLASCSLESGLHTLPATLLIPPGFSLIGPGRTKATLRLNLTTASLSSLHRPGYAITNSYLGPVTAGPLEAVVSCQPYCSGIALSGITFDGGLVASQQAAMIWQCGLGLGSDLKQPGFAGCHWFSAGIYLPPGSSDITLQSIAVVNAATGVDAVGTTTARMYDVTMVHTGGFGFRLAAAIRMLACNDVTLASVHIAQGIANQGLLFIDSNALNITASSVVGAVGNSIMLINSSVTLHNSTVTQGLQCGIRALNSSHALITASTITNHSQVGFGGICSTRSTVSVTDSSIHYNAFNIASEASHLSLSNVDCSWAFYTPLCADTPVEHDNASCWSDPKGDCKGNFPDLKHESSQQTKTSNTLMSSPFSMASPALTSAAAQACIDSAAARAQHLGEPTVCQLSAGQYLFNSTVLLRANVTVQGAAPGATQLRSNMSTSYIASCSQRSNCALLSVDNTSRSNIALVDLQLIGRIAQQQRQAQRTSCGRVLFGNASTADTVRCGFYEFGVLVTDYWDGGSPRNFTMRNVSIEDCAMGIHVLGTTGVLFEGVELHNNGMGNGFYHNAYFLRTSDLVIRDSVLRNATGHGLKLGPSIANVTLSNVTIADNEWQGVWLGDGVNNVSMSRLLVLRNWQNGLQLSDVTNLTVADSVIQGQASGFHAGLRLDGAHQAVLRNVALQGNGHGLVVEHSDDVSQDNVTDAAWYP